MLVVPTEARWVIQHLRRTRQARPSEGRTGQAGPPETRRIRAHYLLNAGRKHFLPPRVGIGSPWLLRSVIVC